MINIESPPARFSLIRFVLFLDCFSIFASLEIRCTSILIFALATLLKSLRLGKMGANGQGVPAQKLLSGQALTASLLQFSQAQGAIPTGHDNTVLAHCENFARLAYARFDARIAMGTPHFDGHTVLVG